MVENFFGRWSPETMGSCWAAGVGLCSSLGDGLLRQLVAAEQCCRIFGAYRLEFSSSIRQLVGLGGLFCQLNGPEQGSLITMI